MAFGCANECFFIYFDSLRETYYTSARVAGAGVRNANEWLSVVDPIYRDQCVGP